MLKRLTLCIGLAVGMVLFVQSQVSAAPKGTLRVALTTMPNSIDVANAAERNAHNVAWQIFDTLIWVDNSGKVTPGLAKSWTLSKDGTTYTFKLRKNVTFHNGEKMNADSIVYSWKRGQRKEMKWAKQWLSAKSVTKVDDYTVNVITEKPNPLLLRQMAGYWGIVPPGYLNKVGESGFAAHPIGTGPFKFVEWKKGDRIILEANTNYFEPQYPKLAKIAFRPIPESSTRLAAIQTGEIDIATRLSAEESAMLQGSRKVRTHQYPSDRVYYITFNNLTSGKGQPTESPLVRQAMNYAVDIQGIIDALFNGNGRQSTGFVTPANLGYDESIQPFGYDPKKAKSLLAKAGYPKGFDIGFACPSGAYINFEQVCEAIQGYLSEVGINTDLQLMESGKYWDLESKKQLPPLFGDSWSERAGEALPRLQGALGGMAASYSAWSDPKIDDYLKKIESTMDDGKRAALYVSLQRYMQENPPFIYIYELMTFEAYNPKVKGFYPRAAEDYYLKTVYLEN